MTLSIHRPKRSFDEQWIVEANDIHGLRKDLEEAIAKYGEDGLIETIYYEGAADSIDALFCDGGLDTRFDFMRRIKQKYKERRDG